MPVRILIAADHAVFRSGLRALLEKEADLEVVGEAGTGSVYFRRNCLDIRNYTVNYF